MPSSQVIPRNEKIFREVESCLASLEESVDVDPACDLADEDGREALGAQPLVHAQEVYLHHLHGPGMFST